MHCYSRPEADVITHKHIGRVTKHGTRLKFFPSCKMPIITLHVLDLLAQLHCVPFHPSRHHVSQCSLVFPFERLTSLHYNVFSFVAENCLHAKRTIYWGCVDTDRWWSLMVFVFVDTIYIIYCGHQLQYMFSSEGPAMNKITLYCHADILFQSWGWGYSVLKDDQRLESNRIVRVYREVIAISVCIDE